MTVIDIFLGVYAALLAASLTYGVVTACVKFFVNRAYTRKMLMPCQQCGHVAQVHVPRVVMAGVDPEPVSCDDACLICRKVAHPFDTGGPFG